MDKQENVTGKESLGTDPPAYEKVLKAGGYYKSEETWQGRLQPITGETGYPCGKKKINSDLDFMPYINSSQSFFFKKIEDTESFCLYIYQYLLHNKLKLRSFRTIYLTTLQLHVNTNTYF